MNIIYFKSDIGNFGDDLNPWLWKQVLGDFENYRDDLDFIGIGSILDERIKSDNAKVVFGSGVRDFQLDISTISKLDILFVRGPISSVVTRTNTYISDAAYALRLLPKKTYTKKYKLSIVPYFRHANQFNWRMFERITGIHVILPTQEVERVIDEINASEQILASAMHGAILADIYRVPWMRVKFSKHGSESALTSEIKWTDWLLSIDLEKAPTHVFDFTLNHRKSKLKTFYCILMMRLKFRRNTFINSKDSVINEIDKKIAIQISKFKEKYKK